MASQSDETGDDGKRQEVVSADDRQSEIAGELIELQRERNELARRYLELSQQEIQLDYDLSWRCCMNIYKSLFYNKLAF